MMQSFEQLEHKWAEFNELDPKGMVACSSGTAALHLALEAFRLPPGSEILVPDYTMVACPRAVTMAGLTPIFIDCQNDLLVNVEEMERRTGEETSALMAVHVYGRRCDMGGVISIGDNQELKVIEDLAEAHGIKLSPHPGTDAACWSFYKNKIVAGEEGGAVWFRNPDHAALARSLRTLGFTDAHDYTHIPRGHNYRMSNLHAERILDVTAHRWTCMQEIVGNLERRRGIESWFDEFCPAEWKQPARDAVWVYDVRIPGMTAEIQKRVMDELRLKGLPVRYGFKPCRKQEEYQDDWEGGFEWESDRASREVIYFPVEPGVTTKDDARRAFEIIRHVMGLKVIQQIQVLQSPS